MKFLIIRFSSIGDIVLTTPVIRCLKKQVPGAEVHFLTKETFHSIVEHNPYIDNTVDGLVKGIGELQKNGIAIQIEKIHRVLGEGNFVLVVSEGKFAGKPNAFFDLFRIDQGLVVEHWDVLQEVPEKMAHNNGMF